MRVEALDQVNVITHRLGQTVCFYRPVLGLERSNPVHGITLRFAAADMMK